MDYSHSIVDKQYPHVLTVLQSFFWNNRTPDYCSLFCYICHTNSQSIDNSITSADNFQTVEQIKCVLSILYNDGQTSYMQVLTFEI